MRILLFLFISSFFCQNSWNEFVDYDGRFKINVPGTLNEKIDSTQTDVGTLVYHSFFYQDRQEGSDNHIYMVSYCDYPQGIIFADSSNLTTDFFSATIASAAESVDGEVRYQSDIRLGDHPGKFWRIDYLDGEAVIKTKAYLVNNRYYALQTISFQEKNLNRSTDRFFDSFKLL